MGEDCSNEWGELMDTINGILIVLVAAVAGYGIGRLIERKHPRIVEKPVHLSTPYLPEALLYLAGAQPGPDGGWILDMGGDRFWYTGSEWKYLESSRIKRGYGKWMQVNQNRVLVIMEDVANEKWHQQQQMSIQPVVQQAVIAQPSNNQMQWPVQKDSNGKRIPNVSVQQAEQWYMDNDFGWTYDPNSTGLLMPEPYVIRKDKQQNSPTFGKWIVDKRKP